MGRVSPLRRTLPGSRIRGCSSDPLRLARADRRWVTPRLRRLPAIARVLDVAEEEPKPQGSRAAGRPVVAVG